MLLTAAYQLVAAAQVSQCTEAAPNVYQTGEGENDKQAHAHEHVQFENPTGIDDVSCGITIEGHNVLCPSHQFDHFFAIGVLSRGNDGEQAQHQSQEYPYQYQFVAPCAVDHQALRTETAFD